MNFTHLQWANAEHTQIHATLESGEVILVNGPGLLHYDAIVASGAPIAPYEPLPPTPDANARLDAGINASIAAAEAVRNSIHAVPATFNAANFQAFLIQAKILSDAFVAMLEAQQTAPPP